MFEVFLDLFLPTFSCLEAIARSTSDWNRETHTDAQSLLLALSQFPCMVVLVLSQKILAYTKGLSVKLQGQYVDVVRAYQDIESVKEMIRGGRSRVDDFHSQMYQDVLTLSESVGVTELHPDELVGSSIEAMSH